MLQDRSHFNVKNCLLLRQTRGNEEDKSSQQTTQTNPSATFSVLPSRRSKPHAGYTS